ncbi:hypothetical protein GH733_005746 [Mirounga leonina]|nr:hypothetical protein GH733_005746 [Mirounga leonina]
MSLRPNAASSCARTSPLWVLQGLLVLSLPLTTLLPWAAGESKRNSGKTEGGTATLKKGKKICLDPEAPKIKKIVQKILESDGSTT